MRYAIRTGRPLLLKALASKRGGLIGACSSGIGAIVNALRLSTQMGGGAKLVNPRAFVAQTFKMVGILNLFGVYDSEESAVAACGG